MREQAKYAKDAAALMLLDEWPAEENSSADTGCKTAP